jgi:hypothetical protein
MDAGSSPVVVPNVTARDRRGPTVPDAVRPSTDRGMRLPPAGSTLDSLSGGTAGKDAVPPSPLAWPPVALMPSDIVRCDGCFSWKLRGD